MTSIAALGFAGSVLGGLACLVGIILCPVLARGRAGALGALGFGLVLVGAVVLIVGAVLAHNVIGAAVPRVIQVVLTVAGLIVLALAVGTRPRPGARKV